MRSICFGPTISTAGELFSLLTPSDEQYVGAYAHFLFDLPDTLRTQDLLPALTWATAYIVRSNHMGELVTRRWRTPSCSEHGRCSKDPGLTNPFLAHIAARLHEYGELCRGTDFKANEAFLERLRRG